MTQIVIAILAGLMVFGAGFVSGMIVNRKEHEKKINILIRQTGNITKGKKVAHAIYAAFDGKVVIDSVCVSEITDTPENIHQYPQSNKSPYL